MIPTSIDTQGRSPFAFPSIGKSSQPSVYRRERRAQAPEPSEPRSIAFSDSIAHPAASASASASNQGARPCPQAKPFNTPISVRDVRTKSIRLQYRYAWTSSTFHIERRSTNSGASFHGPVRLCAIKRILVRASQGALCAARSTRDHSVLSGGIMAFDFDVIIVGSGFGATVLAVDQAAKNKSVFI